jgi:serine/threonine protein kinase
MTEKDFFERYTYNSETDSLGSGGFGTVYKAYDNQEKIFVALKISQVKDVHGKFTLLNEVRLSKEIDHHVNIARYDHSLRVTKPFLIDYAIMEYYPLGNLEMLAKNEHSRLKPAEIEEILVGILEGTKHLHNEGVIHRDLKMANILMYRTKQNQWRPKITDFGLSRQIEAGKDNEESLANSSVGVTVAYAAPEQINNKTIRKNVDLWAYGIIAYRLFSGELPYKADPGTDTMTANLEISRKIINENIPYQINDIPEPFRTVITKCLIKDSAQRVQTAEELLDLLGRGHQKTFSTKQPSPATKQAAPPRPQNQQQQAAEEHTMIMPESSPQEDNHTVLISNFQHTPSDEETALLSNELDEQTLVYGQGSPLVATPANNNNYRTYLLAAAALISAIVLGWYFTKPTSQAISSQVVTNQPTPNQPTANAEEVQYKQAESSGKISELASFIQKFPNAQNKELAEKQIAILETRFKNLVNDANVFIDGKEYGTARDYLSKALIIKPEDKIIISKLDAIKNK